MFEILIHFGHQTLKVNGYNLFNHITLISFFLFMLLNMFYVNI